MPIHFKPHLNQPSKYKGGKAKIEANGPIQKLSSNENQFGVSPLALKAIQAGAAQINEYPDRTDLRLRQALSDFYSGELTPDQFFTSNGAVRGIDMIMLGFLEEGNEVIFSNPGFGPYRAFPNKYGATSIDIPLIGSQFDLDVKGILNSVTDSTRLLFIASPNNPTGTCPKKTDLDELINELPDHVVIVYDEVYFHFAEQEDFVRGLPYVLQGKSVIALNSFSKAYGMAGMRIGYGYSSEKIASYLRKLPTPFPINALSTNAAIAALNDTDFIEMTVSKTKEGKAYLYEELSKLNIPFWKSQANFILLNPNMDALELEEKMLAKGIMVRPSKNFGFHGIRLTVGTMEQNKMVISALKEILG